LSEATGTRIIDTNAKLNDRIFKVNLASHFILIKEFLPGMLKARKGHVVTIASMASFMAAPGLVDYCCTKIGALYLTEGMPSLPVNTTPFLALTYRAGLRSELRVYHGAEGRCIQTTSVHPSWHATGIVKPFEDKLEKFGIKCDPASNVSDAVVEQVLAGRSGRIFVPKTEEANTGVRNFPVWLQDAVMYLNKKRFQF
jgi:NAD(P)-dependent dehydrogenase (short-subunit alcohol dehydrogenase family)